MKKKEGILIAIEKVESRFILVINVFRNISTN